ncbi:gelsolin [Aplysia californica]|uniref:Actin-modulator n=1 Tax=Aplysia californica TaxID=6500 RepID=E6Y6Q1_APLCA|nr:gelsolin [Aplysia californica]ACN94418.1 gelsolin [Aplysia californica]
MSGLVKAKKYDWKDSNLALFGSDVEKNVKKESAEQEPAWKNAGSQVGIQIWRIVKFKVQPWPKEDYGKFFEGDSYIILNTYKEQDTDQLLYDVHFWIGRHSTQDEYGTAAYKTVELDTLLDDVPVQHREVQGHESELFKSYFKSITIMKGGAETGFRHVKPEEYKQRLLQITGNKQSVTVTEVPLNKNRVTAKDVFVLDNGLEIFQWNGEECAKEEKYKAVQVVQQIRSERGGKPSVEVFDQNSDDGSTFFDHFNDNEDDDDDSEYEDNDNKTPELYRLSDSSGEFEFERTKEGRVFKDDFSSKDVFIFDNKKEVFVWIGKSASKSENQNALSYAHKYLQGTQHPLLPITCVKEGKENKFFRSAIAA